MLRGLMAMFYLDVLDLDYVISDIALNDRMNSIFMSFICRYN